jgi:hypothetical protein
MASAMTNLEIFEQEHSAKIAAMEEAHKLTLAKAKAALEEAQLKKKQEAEMAEIAAQMAAMFPPRPNYAGAVIAANAHPSAIIAAEIAAQKAAMFPPRPNYAGAVIAANAHPAAIAAAGGGAEDENIVEHIAEHFAEHEPVMYKLYGFCNDFINGMECRFGRCQYTHPEVEFKPNEYNFPKKLQTMPDGSSRDYRLMGFCVDTLNGRHCKNNRCRFTHPKDYQFGEIPAGKKRELGDFRKSYPNWPTA